MTHLAMPEEWTFGSVDLSTYAIMVASVDGVDAFPELRGEDLPVPGIPGRRPQGKDFDSRRQSLALYVLP